MTDTVFQDYVTPVPAAWLNDIDKTVYQALGAAGVAPTTAAQVIANLNLQNLYISKTPAIITVGSSGCQYTSIQAALTANPVANTMFFVMDGIYANDTINFTANTQCVVGIGTSSQQTVTQASTTICNAGNFTNCRLCNLTLNITAATSAVSAIVCNNGTIRLIDVDVNITNSTTATASQPSISNITGTGTVEFEFGNFTYNNSVSDGTGSTAVKAAFLLGNGIVELEGCDLLMTCSGLSLGSTVAYTTGTGYLSTIGVNELVVTDTGGTVVVGYFSAGSGTLTELAYSDWTITGGGANSCIGIYLSGTASIRSHHNDFVITGGATNYSVNVASGATITSLFDVFQAASGKTGAGTFNNISSDSSNNLVTSSNIIIGAGSNHISAYTGPYTDGTVIDYATGNGRISVGTADTLSIYNGGVANTLLAQFSATNASFTGSITPSQTGGIIGTTTNNNANAGSVGEFITNTVASSAINLVSSTPVNITSISLTAGDWDVWGSIIFAPAATTTITQVLASINTVSANIGTAGVNYAQTFFPSFAPGGTSIPTREPPIVRISIAATTTVYLIGQSSFATSTMTAGGTINARRVR